MRIDPRDQYVTKPSPNDEFEYKHGTASCYVRHGCRCDDCREANRIRMREYRGGGERRETDRQHGTRACYYAGCRREECVEANRKYARDHARDQRKRRHYGDLDAFIFEEADRPQRRVSRREPQHGTVTEYKNYECRCRQCREAYRDARARWMQVRIAQTKNPDDPRHGTADFYTNYSCRCNRCREARRVADKERRDSVDERHY